MRAHARGRVGGPAGRRAGVPALRSKPFILLALILLALHVSLRNRSEIAKGAPGGLRAVIFAMVVTL